MKFPPLDAHAHVSVDIPERELLLLKSVVLVATRSISEYVETHQRKDPLAVWGVGVHPGVPEAVTKFSAADLRAQLRRSPLLSEVGLDRRSSVPFKDQKRVLKAALTIHDESACIASVHSAGRTSELVKELEGHRCSTIVLHWWRGTVDETLAAVELGCFFSVNPRDDDPKSVLNVVPSSRVLTETDHPYGDQGQPNARPGGIEAVEARLDQDDSYRARLVVWRNFERLVSSAGILQKLPSKVAGLLMSVSNSEDGGHDPKATI
jgi:TatD DNase family protein